MSKAVSSMMLIVAVLFLAPLAEGAAALPRMPESPHAQETRALLNPKSSALAIVFEAFHESGYDPNIAIGHAHRALGMSYPDIDVAQPWRPGSVLLHPKSSALSSVYEAFHESGWSPEESMEHALAALHMEPQGEGCKQFAYQVYFTFCDSGSETYVSGWINSRCLEDPDGDPQTADGLQVCNQFSCLPPNQYKWMNLTVESSCGGLPGMGSCVQMRVIGVAVHTPCEEVLYDGGCFVETSGAVDCNSIEKCCCSSATAGCHGRPSCTACGSP